MANYADLDDGQHVVGDDFDRLLTLTVLAASFASFRMTVRKTWAKIDDVDDTDPDVIATVTDSDGISVAGDYQLRVQISGADLAVAPARYVYSVKGTTLLGQTFTVVRGILPLYSRAAVGP